MTDLPEPTIEEMKSWLRWWGSENNCLLADDAECGFGRPCVGMVNGTRYVDYGGYVDLMTGEMYTSKYMQEIYQPVAGSAPDDAYHKDTVLAVLVHIETDNEADRTAFNTAIKGLHAWVRAIDELGLTVKICPRKSMNDVDAILNGLMIPRLVKK